MTGLTYAIITPARDERENLTRLAAAVGAQSLPPLCWVIVDDGSCDGTAELARALAQERPNVVALDGATAAGRLSEGRRDGRPLRGFQTGIAALRVRGRRADVVVKVDADTSFDPDYFERLVARFAAEPALGIAGGVCLELERGTWVRQRVAATHPRGASRAYRSELLPLVMGLEARMGWDGLDEHLAQVRGFRTRCFTDLAFRHHRATGGRERHPLRHHTAQGRAAWYMGYRPTYLLLRSLYRQAGDPRAFGMAMGYLGAAVRREPRYGDPAVRRHIRSQQRLRVALRRGSPGLIG